MDLLEARRTVGKLNRRCVMVHVGLIAGETSVTAYLLDAVGITLGRKVLIAPAFNGDRLTTTSWLIGGRLR
ncbi:MAG: hypothetical protein ABI625_04060 [bacterium]